MLSTSCRPTRWDNCAPSFLPAWCGLIISPADPPEVVEIWFLPSG